MCVGPLGGVPRKRVCDIYASRWGANTYYNSDADADRDTHAHGYTHSDNRAGAR